MEVYTWNPSSKEVEAGRTLGLIDQPASYTVGSRPMRDPVLKNREDGF